MKQDNYTIKSQESIQNAINIANENSNQSIENSHLLLGIIKSDEKVLNFILAKQSVNIENIKSILTNIIQSNPKIYGGEAYFSKDLSKTLNKSEQLAKENKDEYVSIEILFLALLYGNDNISNMLKDAGVKIEDTKKIILELRKGENVKSQTSDENYNSLSKYAHNLNEMALSGKLDPVIGRDEEIRRMLQIISRRTKNNPILIGEPGVGKTALAEGLAHRIIRGDVPENIKSKVIYSLDLGALVAGAKYKGEFEDRLKSVTKEVIKSNGEIILFIDEIHTIVGAGKGEGAMDAANILKPALARGDLRAIGATTLNEYQKFFEKDKALERRFQTVLVDEPDTYSAISILRGIKDKYEAHHKVRIKDEAIISAVELSQRYISDRRLPDKAIDLIDEAASKLKMELNSVPEEIDELDKRIKQLTIEREGIKREKDKIKIEKLTNQIENLNQEVNILRAKWKNEKDIITKIQLNKSKIDELKIKAENAERDGNYGVVAEIKYGKIKSIEEEIIKLNNKLNKFQENNPLIKEEVDSEDIAEVISRWTGIPIKRMLQSEIEKLLNLEQELHKRVVGQEQAISSISDAVRRSRAGLQDDKKPIGSFIFLGTTGVGKTELAKALAEFLFNNENMLTRIDMSEYQERHSVSRLIGAPPGYVGYDEGGQLTEAVRHKPYSVVLLDEIEKAHPDVFNILLQVLDDGRLTDNKGRVVNFKNTIIIMTSNIGSHIIQEETQNINAKNRDEIIKKTEVKVFELLKKSIRPEFLNRVDDIIMFTPLDKDEIKQIVNLQLDNVKSRLDKNNIKINITDNAVQLIADAGFDPIYGARPLKRAIQNYILNNLSKQILAGKINSENKIVVDVENNNIIFRN